jgi:hypothetical protein
MPGKDLVTEANVRQMAPGAELWLGPDRIATPAALDLAFQRGIRVRHGQKPSGGGGDCGCDHTCLWSKIKSTDGTYVVSVSGGRARVARVAEGGPQPFGEE